MAAPPSTSPHPQGPSILSLPAELRLYIYEAALEPTLELATDPWSKFPPWSRFSALLGLALTSRQISAEATSLYYKSFAPRARLYFDDAVKLHDFCTWAVKQGERVRRLKVLLTIRSSGNCFDGGYFYWESWVPTYSRGGDRRLDSLRSDSIGLLLQQPGSGGEGSSSAYESNQVAAGLFRIPLARIGYNNEWVDDLSPDCGLEKRYHRSPMLPGGIGRHNSLTVPMLETGLGVTTHVCVATGCCGLWGGVPQYHNAIMEMEGEAWTIDFSKFRIAEKRARKYHQTRCFFAVHDWWEESECWLDPAEWADDRPDSEVDSWAPSSWYASESEESYIYLDDVEEKKAKKQEEENPSEL